MQSVRGFSSVQLAFCLELHDKLLALESKATAQNLNAMHSVKGAFIAEDQSEKIR